MPLSWNEIRNNAISFSREGASEEREQAEAKTFWDEFFRVFGLTRRHLASFEEPVKSIKGTYGFIDLFWKGMLLAEHKSAGKDLNKAHSQAMDYIQDLQREQRTEEVPRYVIVSDFRRIALHDLEMSESHVFGLGEFYENIHLFGFIPGYKQHTYQAQDPINLKAVHIMGDLHDALEGGGYTGHELERFLVRVLFCLFADDTGIFTRSSFQLYLENHTQRDGGDLGPQLALFFQTLNDPAERRQTNLREELAELPYVNGELFAEQLSFAAFSRDMRNRLLACTRFDWSRISPAVFGALFQSVMEPRERRQIGAHYTNERDILKVIEPLFLDDLRESLKSASNDRRKLMALQERLAEIRLLDPACGCGNFLVVAYRELRSLEIEILKKLHLKELQKVLDIQHLSRVDVDQMHGIEIEEWPVRIAEVALWLMDHQMNLQLSQAFGHYFVRLPLLKSPRIYLGNALRIDWNDVLPAGKCSFVLGNPPFVGGKFQSDEQRRDMAIVAHGVNNAGLLDYVCGWYLKASEYISNTQIACAFVSTNSISQGEQVGVLWRELLHRGMRIQFAHRTFAWESEARGKAHIHVVIVGFANSDARRKFVFEYRLPQSESTRIEVSNIAPYLVEGPSVTIENRSKPLCSVPEINIGNKPIDDGNYLFTREQMKTFVLSEPKSKKFFRRWYGSNEFINREERWCLWLGDCSPDELRSMPQAMERVKRVKSFREASQSKPTQKLAATPTRFHVENMPRTHFLLIPKVSSERRTFIPMGFMSPKILCSDLVFLMQKATRFHFGVLSSTMHMAWVRYLAGRLESRYRYSAKLVYNNFPWPQNVSDAKRARIELAAKHVLEVRDEFADATLADLYDPLSMPAKLVKAHAQLDKAVDLCYRATGFPSERHRIQYLFELYQQLSTPLISEPKRVRKPKEAEDHS